MKKIRRLESSGKIDYDYVNDILYVRVDDRDYSHSVELLGYVVDIGTEGFIIGLQIFNASVYFKISKTALRQIKNYSLEASLIEGILEVRLSFNVMVRNKIVEKTPILVQQMGENLPNSTVLCTI